jgi:hypothetical protein
MRRDEIPYFSQFASPELIADIVAGHRDPAADPRWRESGAETPEDYAFRARTGCGMACLQMVLAAHGRPVPGLAELWQRCAAYGGYRPDGRKGLHYAGLKAFADAELDLETRVAAPLPLAGLGAAVQGDEIAFASVHREIRSPGPSPGRGGHLVLVVDATEDALCFHNPSGTSPATQRAVWMDAERFGTYYAGRGIVVALPRVEPASRSRAAAG